jgi:hypothetical protein
LVRAGINVTHQAVAAEEGPEVDDHASMACAARGHHGDSPAVMAVRPNREVQQIRHTAPKRCRIKGVELMHGGCRESVPWYYAAFMFYRQNLLVALCRCLP